jgi:hypothetical protein
VIGVEPVHSGASPERLLEVGKLGVGQARGVPGRAGATQRIPPAHAPAGVPAAGVLAGDAELVSDLSLGAAGGKQCAGLQTDSFQRLAVTQTTGAAAVGCWLLVSCRYAAKRDQQVKPLTATGAPSSCRCWQTAASRTLTRTDDWRSTLCPLGQSAHGPGLLTTIRGTRRSLNAGAGPSGPGCRLVVGYPRLKGLM